jgi:hypothetical protein
MSSPPSRNDTNEAAAPRRWRRFAALSGAERRLWMAAWWALLRADLELRLLGTRAVRRALAGPAASAAPPPAPDAPAKRVAELLASAAAHHLWAMTCLPRSLALARLLARRGIPARLALGVRAAPRGIAAHAWVEVGGEPLAEPEEIGSRFLPLARRDS